jgi:hypothetical protein
MLSRRPMEVVQFPALAGQAGSCSKIAFDSDDLFVCHGQGLLKICADGSHPSRQRVNPEVGPVQTNAGNAFDERIEDKILCRRIVPKSQAAVVDHKKPGRIVKKFQPRNRAFCRDLPGHVSRQTEDAVFDSVTITWGKRPMPMVAGSQYAEGQYAESQ